MAAGITKPTPAASTPAVAMTIIAATTKPTPKVRYRYPLLSPRFDSSLLRRSRSLTTPPVCSSSESFALENPRFRLHSSLCQPRCKRSLRSSYLRVFVEWCGLSDETRVGDFLKRLRVLMTRQEIVPERLAGATAVVIDVFMATTTLLTILENGARDVYPVAGLEKAGEVGAKLDAAGILRGGEQDAARIEGYDHGPFPDEYPPDRVADRDVIFVTTNGTRAIADASPAGRVLLGCLRNAPAVARYLESSGAESVYLICAGSAGRFTIEDFLGAATILSHMNTGGWRLNDGAGMALDFMNRYRNRELEALKQSRAGRWFFEHDRVDAFEFVGETGSSELVPEVKAGMLGPASPASYQPGTGSGTRGGYKRTQ